MNMKRNVSLLLFVFLLPGYSLAGGTKCLEDGVALSIFDGRISIPSSFYINGRSVFRDGKLEFFTDLKNTDCIPASISYSKNAGRVKEVVDSVDGKLVLRDKNVCGLNKYQVKLPPSMVVGEEVENSVYIKGDEILQVGSSMREYHKYIEESYCASVVEVVEK